MVACRTETGDPVPWGFSPSYTCEDSDAGSVYSVSVEGDGDVVAAAEFGRDDATVSVRLEPDELRIWSAMTPLTTSCDGYEPADWYLQVTSIYGTTLTEEFPGEIPNLLDSGA
jgi:hypothetical protein